MQCNRRDALEPTCDEIAALLKDMQALGLQFGSRIKPEVVMAELKSCLPVRG